MSSISTHTTIYLADILKLVFMIQINIDMTSYVSKAIGGFLRGKATEALNKIDNPIVRSGLGSIANAIDPRILGAAQINDSNIFKAEYDRRAVDLYNELNQASAPSSRISGSSGETYDWRARLRPKRGGQDRFYAPGGNFSTDYLMRPIKESNGLIWPSTPSIFVAASANYGAHSGQGMQYPVRNYEDSSPPDITVTGDFSANDIYEARYLLGVLTFFKIATKGDFGDQAVAKETAGAPPPVLLFEYLGDHAFNKVPVVVANYSLSYPNDVDYVPVKVSGTTTYVPTLLNIVVTLQPQYTPSKVRRRFDVQSVANGEAYKDGFI